MLAELGEHSKTGSVLNNVAINFANEGKLDRAEQLYRQARFHFEQPGDKGNTATALGNIADIAFLRGDLAAAGKLYEQAIDTSTFQSNAILGGAVAAACCDSRAVRHCHVSALGCPPAHTAATIFSSVDSSAPASLRHRSALNPRFPLAPSLPHDSAHDCSWLSSSMRPPMEVAEISSLWGHF
jgi:tetratricopeptide (TPR) repeat protein